MKIINKADIMLVVIILIIGLAPSLVFGVGEAKGSEVKITVDNKLYGSYDIFSDATIIIDDSENSNETNVVKIEKGKVFMEEANCIGNDCVHQGAKENTGESIICLPHKVLIEIEGGESNYDSVTR